MRIIMSATPQHGHLLPLLPLARALRDRGDEVAVLTSGALSPVVEAEGLRPLPVGPAVEVVLAEVKARTGMDAAHDPTPEAVSEFFAGTRVDLTADEALAAAREFQPDLTIRETCDYIGPLVAAAQDAPLATLAFGPALPPEFLAPLDATAEARYAVRGMRGQPSTWHLDTCPPSLQPDGWRQPAGWQPLRPEPHRAPGAPDPGADRGDAGPAARPRVLVSFGTLFGAPDALSPMLRQLCALDIDIVATLGLLAAKDQFDVDHSRVSFVPFTPLADLLRGVDAVLTHGGAGTTLAALSRGIPLVIVPQGADQFIQAERVPAAGAGIALAPGDATPQAVAAAVQAVLAERPIRQAAASIAKEIASMPPASEVAAILDRS
jgi:UDP:flavonoid glycosyltransferase YjiC (YdhE family)